MQPEEATGHRVLVIGLDGATFRILRPLSAAGLLPNLTRLMEMGNWGALRSTVPPHSAPAWSTFATGVNPGKHGVYHFRPIDRQFYEGGFDRVVNARSIAQPSLWARASQAGKRVGVINVPLTYPPEPVNGFIVSGMLTPPTAPTFTFPKELSSELKTYIIDADAGQGRGELEQANFQTAEGVQWLADSLDEQRAVRTDTALRLFSQYEPDLAVVVFTETDRLHHFFWPCLDEEVEVPPRLQPFSEWAQAFYTRLDASVGELVDWLGPEGIAILLSDHGFGPYPSHQFYVNAWLKDLGLLKVSATSVRSTPSRLLSRLGLSQSQLHRLLSRFLPQYLVRRLRSTWGAHVRQPIDWGETQAFYMPLFEFVGGIVINKPPHGTDYDALRDRIISALRDLRDPETGDRVVTATYRREEIYTGPYTDLAPDVIMILDTDYVGDRSLLTQSYFSAMAAAGRQWTGTHRFDGVLIANGPGIRPGQRVSPAMMEDVAPTLMHLLGLPIPRVMDGRIVEEMLTTSYRAAHPVRYTAGEDESYGDQSAVWQEEDEQEQVVERLRSLGYLE